MGGLFPGQRRGAAGRMGICCGGRDGIREALGARAVGGMAEEGGTGNEHVRTGGHKSGRIFGAGPAVHLQQRPVGAVFIQQGAGGAELVVTGGNEFLSREAGIDAHDQRHVDIGGKPAQTGNVRAGIEGQTGLAAQTADFRQRALRMRIGFRMNDEHIRAGITERGNMPGGVRNHQVHIEEKGCAAAQGLDDGSPEGDVGHKDAVHHIKVQPADAGIEVWEYRGMLYVRSVFQAVWPAWTASAAMEGHTLYVMPKTPSLVFSKEGRRQAYIVKGLAYGAEQ